MGLFFKVSQAIQTEFNKELRKTKDPEDFLHELIEDLERKEEELRGKYNSLLDMQKKEEAGSPLYEKFQEKLNKMSEDLENMRERRSAAKRRYEFYRARQNRMNAHSRLNEAMKEIDDVSRYDIIKKRQE